MASSSLASRTLKYLALVSGAASSFNIKVPAAVDVALQVAAIAQVLRFLVQRRFKKFLLLSLFSLKYALAKDGEARSTLGHFLYDLSRIPQRLRYNLPPSLLLRRKPMRHGPFARHKADLEAARELGPIVSANRFAFAGTKTFIFVSDPDAVEQVMTDKITYPSRGPTGFTDTTPYGLLGLPSGDLHTKHRRLIGKFMTNRYLEEFSKVIEEETKVLVKKWKEKALQEEPTNVCYDLSMITLQIIMRASVGTTGEEINLQHVEEKDNEDYHGLDYALKEIMISTAFPILGIHPTPRLRFLKQKFERKFKETMRKADELYKNSNGASTIYSTLRSLGTKGKEEDILSDREIMDEMQTIRGAGHETTSHTLSWCLLLLSQNPDCFDKLRSEAHEQISGEIATYEETKNMPYTHMVVYETLRMYPTVPSFPREAAMDSKLLGYDVPKDSLVFVCQNAMNRSEKLWEEPDEFKPERFEKLPELLISKPIGIPNGHNYGFIPFGAVSIIT